jgi:hypothetical protein
MTDSIQWARLADLSIVSTLPWPLDASCMYLERIPDAWLDEPERRNGLRLEKFDASIAFSEWERGRVFCDSFELRWEKLNDAFQVVYVGVPIEIPGFAPADEMDLNATTRQMRSYILWGRRLPDDQLETVGRSKSADSNVFIEPRVPRVLCYPVSDRSWQVKIKVCEYVDPISGEMLYYRFQGLEEVL